MSKKRLLLPFTGNLNAQALDYAVKLAQHERATLLLLSLIVVPSDNRSVRLERIQQSKDFLVLAACKARRGDVPVEAHEIYTHDAVVSMTLLAQEQMCDAILLFVRNRDGVLLHTREVKRTLEQRNLTCCLICIPTPQYIAVWTRLARLWKKPGSEETWHVHTSSVDEDIDTCLKWIAEIEPGYVMSWPVESCERIPNL